MPIISECVKVASVLRNLNNQRVIRVKRGKQICVYTLNLFSKKYAINFTILLPLSREDDRQSHPGLGGKVKNFYATSNDSVLTVCDNLRWHGRTWKHRRGKVAFQTWELDDGELCSCSHSFNPGTLLIGSWVVFCNQTGRGKGEKNNAPTVNRNLTIHLICGLVILTQLSKFSIEVVARNCEGERKSSHWQY
jgi:hypothetical protein